MKAFWQSRGEAIEVLQLGDCGGLNTCLCKAYTIFFLGPQCSHGDVTCALFVSPHFCTHYLLSSTSQLHSIKSVTQILLKKKKRKGRHQNGWDWSWNKWQSELIIIYMCPLNSVTTLTTLLTDPGLCTICTNTCIKHYGKM